MFEAPDKRRRLRARQQDGLDGLMALRISDVGHEGAVGRTDPRNHAQLCDDLVCDFLIEARPVPTAQSERLNVTSRFRGEQLLPSNPLRPTRRILQGCCRSEALPKLICGDSRVSWLAPVGIRGLSRVERGATPMGECQVRAIRLGLSNEVVPRCRRARCVRSKTGRGAMIRRRDRAVSIV